MNTTFCSENWKVRDHPEDVDVDGMIILKWILEKLCWKMWDGFMWLRIGTSGGLFWIW